MSANNFYFAHQVDDTWYGWDEMAEESAADNGKRVLSLIHADAMAKSLPELEEELDKRGLGYSEYGITTKPYLPKDGTPIEIII